MPKVQMVNGKHLERNQTIWIEPEQNTQKTWKPDEHGSLLLHVVHLWDLRRKLTTMPTEKSWLNPLQRPSCLMLGKVVCLCTTLCKYSRIYIFCVLLKWLVLLLRCQHGWVVPCIEYPLLYLGTSVGSKACRFIAIEVQAPLMNALECPCAVSVCELESPSISQHAMVESCWTPWTALHSTGFEGSANLWPWTLLIDDLQVQPKHHLGQTSTRTKQGQRGWLPSRF